MQESASVSFDVVLRKSPIEAWHVVAAVLVFAAVVWFVVWRMRRTAVTINLEGIGGAKESQ